MNLIPTDPTYALIYTCFYALICTAIFLRVMLFNRRGGEYKALPAWLAWVLCVASGSVPLRLLVGGVPIPDLSSVVLAVFLFSALIKPRGSVFHLLPHRKSAAAATKAISTRDLCRRFQP